LAVEVLLDGQAQALTQKAIEMALASYPGFFGTGVPGEESAYGVYWPALVPADVVEAVVVMEDGSRRPVGTPPFTRAPALAASAHDPPRHRVASPLDAAPSGPTRRVPLGTVFGARSGDKGGNANVGVWARNAAGYGWLEATLTVERFRDLVPEAAGCNVLRHELPNLLALNFVAVGLLGEGVASSVRFDPQAKGLGEFLRSRLVDLPEALLP
jgi:hypothetical protein